MVNQTHNLTNRVTDVGAYAQIIAPSCSIYTVCTVVKQLGTSKIWLNQVILMYHDGVLGLDWQELTYSKHWTQRCIVFFLKQQWGCEVRQLITFNSTTTVVSLSNAGKRFYKHVWYLVDKN